MKTVAIITAAGQGKRMGQPKQFLEIGGKPMLEVTISVFENTTVIDEIILVVNKEDLERAKQFKFSKLGKVVTGGKERQDSVLNALKVLPEDAEIIAIHDGARPFVTSEVIENAVREASKDGAVVVGVPIKDTVKRVDSRKTSTRPRRDLDELGRVARSSRSVESLKVESSVNRNELWAAQTPQVFKKDIILKAFQEGYNKYEVTDDAMLVEKMGVPVKMVMGSYRNIKITTPDDLKMAEGILKRKERKDD